MIALNMIVIPLQIGPEVMQGLDARELHAFLEVATPFNDWIARRISTYGFADGLDFYAELRESQGGRPAKEYSISISMAKELAMVERGEKGRQARAYFLECERRAKAAANRQSQDMTAALRDPATLRSLLLDQADSHLRLQHEAARLQDEVSRQAPRAAAFDRLVDGRDSMSLTEAAKVLGIKPRQFNSWLSSMKWIYRARDDGNWMGASRFCDGGHLEHRLYVPENSHRQCVQVLVTNRGLARLAQLLEEASMPTAFTPTPASHRAPGR